MKFRTIIFVALVFPLMPLTAMAQAAIATKTLAETKVHQLPSGELAWRVEMFPTREAAQEAAGATSLILEYGGEIWLATLGPAGSASAGGTLVAEIGPVVAPHSAEYLLRIVELTGSPGAQTPVHNHPGSETYYILQGQLTLHSTEGRRGANAGQTLVGPSAGTSMQVSSTGTDDLVALAFFVVDSAQPFSSPATFEKPGCTYFVETGYYLCNGFRAYWERFGGLAVYGYPITNEFQSNGMTVQWFERARFEWHPGAWPERYDVLLGRIGAELAEQMGVGHAAVTSVDSSAKTLAAGGGRLLDY